MKKILLTVFTAIFAYAAATAQLTGIVVESASDGSIGSCGAPAQPAGTTTYRVYAELQDPTDILVAVVANEGAVAGVTFPCHPLDISTTTSFFNSGGGATRGDLFNSLFCGFAPDSGHDSWVTIGADVQAPGISVADDWTNPADPLSPAFGFPSAGASMTAEDGAWYILPGAANGFPVGPNNRVLLGQFTTDGDFSFNLNIAVLDEGVGGANLYYPWNNDVGCVNALIYQDITGLGLTFPAPATPGCTDAAACNFDATASVDDGSCDFGQILDMFDSFGDGWNGASYEIYDLADPFAPALIAAGDLDGAAAGDGSSVGTDTFCLADGCYEIVVGGGVYDGEITFDFSGIDAPITAAATGTYSFTVGGVTCPVLGCTDGTALNFDAAATLDDGSCIFPGCVDAPVNVTYCYVNNETSSLTFTEITAGTGVVVLFNAGNMESCCDDMTVYDGADNTAASLGTFTGDLSGLIFQSSGTSLTIELSSDGSWSCDIPVFFSPVTWDYDVYCGTIFGCTDVTATNYDPAALTDDGSCDFDVPGCTDGTALNFDAAATVDDGSCIVPDCVDAPVAASFCYENSTSPTFTYEATTPGNQVAIVVTGGTVESSWDEFIVYDGDELGTELYNGYGPLAGLIFESTTGSITIQVTADVSNSCGSGDQTTITYDVYCGTIFGCTNVAATNYDPAALTDDGSCSFDVLGCTDVAALNYDAAATADDGSCIVPGCVDAPVALSYCYANNEATSLVFTEATLGSGVVIAFNSGDFESCCDDVTVYDGPDNLSPSLGTFTGDVSGLLFQSSGASLTLEIISDLSVACANGSFGTSALNYDVYCADIVLGCTDATACNFDAAAVGDDGSCDFSCYGCTDVAAVNYDPAATIDDGSCVFSTLNDVPALATPISLNVATGPGAGCTGISGEDISAATVVAPEGDYRQTNPDLWYSFVPFSSGNRIQVVTADFDALIEVFDADFNLVTEAGGLTYEDDNFFDGDEVFHAGDLTAGAQYYIRVAPYFAVFGPAIFDICVQTLRDSRCDYGSGPYSLCGTFKADFVYADAYIFNFTSQTTAMTYSSNPQTSTFLTLSNVPELPDGDVYDVAIDAVYDLIDGAGNAEQVICQNDEPCTVDISETILINMRASDNSVNYGPHFPGNYIRANSFVCGAIAYTWRFTRTDNPLLPVEYTTSSSSTYVRISDALGLAVANDGGVYNVEVKPVFANGSITDYGSIDEITIIGAAGVQGDVIVANNNMSEDALRADELVVSPSAMIYPNPSTGDAITLNLNDVAADVEVAVITVTDFVGRTVASQQITISGAQHQEVLNLNNLASGTYLINVNMNGKVLTEKLIIAK